MMQANADILYLYQLLIAQKGVFCPPFKSSNLMGGIRVVTSSLMSSIC